MGLLYGVFVLPPPRGLIMFNWTEVRGSSNQYLYLTISYIKNN